MSCRERQKLTGSSSYSSKATPLIVRPRLNGTSKVDPLKILEYEMEFKLPESSLVDNLLILVSSFCNFFY